MRRFLCSLAMTLATSGLLSLAPLSAHAITSTFTTDLEGWTAVGLDPMFTFIPPAITDIAVTNNAPDMVWSGAGGNPGGYAQFTDAIQDPSSLASAPAAFLGDLSGFIGGTFSFDHRLFDDGPSTEGYAPYAFIIASGEPENLDALVWSAPAPTGPTDWLHFDITLDVTNDSTGLTFLEDVNLSDIDPDFPSVTPSSFGLGGTLSFEEIMADVSLMWVAFELVDNAGEQLEELGGFDNPTLTAIPEPTTASLLALGLTALALRGPRRRG